MSKSICCLAVLMLTPFTVAGDPPQPPHALPIPIHAAQTRPAFAHSKLAPVLNQLYAARFSPGFVGDRRALDHLVKSGDTVDIVLHSKAGRTDEAIHATESLGAEVRSTHGPLVFASAPVSRLPLLADLDSIQRVRRPYESHPHVVSQGVAMHHADTMHANGHTGEGVRVGVLDCGGFSGYQGLLGTELPASVTLWLGGSGDPVGDNVHGAACAEIVHDMAPDAELFFAHDDTEADYYAAIDWFIAQDVDVISYSCGWLGEFPFDGSGLPHNTINAKVEQARAAGIFWVTSAGNSADNDNYQGTYEQIPGYPWHSFEGDWSNGIFSWSGYGYAVHLTWDDWPEDPTTSGSTQDYSLELWYWDGAMWEVVASSNNPQNGGVGQTPYEYIEFTPQVDEWYYLVVNKVNTTRDCFLNLKKSPNGGMIHFDADRSLTVPGDSPDAFTVGAVHWNGHGLEPFSSQGPTLGPGGTPEGGMLKPDVVAADAVDTVTYGLSDGIPWPNGYGFFGTSAACPHVAGAAALLLDALPNLSADQLAANLTGSADDLAPAGLDTMTGYGQLHIDETVIFSSGFDWGDATAWSSSN